MVGKLHGVDRVNIEAEELQCEHGALVANVPPDHVRLNAGLRKPTHAQYEARCGQHSTLSYTYAVQVLCLCRKEDEKKYCASYHAINEPLDYRPDLSPARPRRPAQCAVKKTYTGEGTFGFGLFFVVSSVLYYSILCCAVVVLVRVYEVVWRGVVQLMHSVHVRGYFCAASRLSGNVIYHEV